MHAFAEAGRLAEADRLALVGDPGTGPARVDGLLDPAYLRARAGLIRDDAALPDPVPAGAPPGVRRPACAAAERAPAPSTSAFAVVDAAGDALAATTTVNVNFGAWVTVGGFVLNDALTNFARPADGGCPAQTPRPAASGRRRRWRR